jgi:hypothetical protein
MTTVKYLAICSHGRSRYIYLDLTYKLEHNETEHNEREDAKVDSSKSSSFVLEGVVDCNRLARLQNIGAIRVRHRVI